MAKLSSDGKYVTVEKGDTLWAIARDFCQGTSNSEIQKNVNKLAAINNIRNPDRIVVGQRIYLQKQSGTAVNSASSNKPVVQWLGLLSNADRVLYAYWTWNKANTESYNVVWTYETGQGTWFTGEDTKISVNENDPELSKQSTYNIPANARKVRFKVKPISKKKSNDTYHWTAEWSDVKEYGSGIALPVPSGLKIEIDQYTLTVSVDNVDPLTNYYPTYTETLDAIVFEIFKDNEEPRFNRGQVNVVSGHASYSCAIEAGHEYKARCKRLYHTDESAWSNYTENVSSMPSTPGGITTIRSINSQNDVYLEWEGCPTADHYVIGYATELSYFDGSNAVTTVQTENKDTHYTITGITSGDEYFFRVRAVNNDGESPWCEAVSIRIGERPAAPTTWSSTTTAMTGETVNLYWVHNTVDGSSQTFADLKLFVDDVQVPLDPIPNDRPDSEKDKTSVYPIDTSRCEEGATIRWSVRTAGVTLEYSDWSAERTIDIYAPPTLTMQMRDVDDNPIYDAETGNIVLTSFPFKVHALAGPNTQAPTSYHLSIVSNETYETIDNVGNMRVVSSGQNVYSKYFDTSRPLDVVISAGDVNLQNNIPYTMVCTVSMNSGLKADATLDFGVLWEDVPYEPNAEIRLDEETYAAYIRPYCMVHELNKYIVTKSGNTYVATDTVVDLAYGTIIPRVQTTTGEAVYAGVNADGEDIYYCFRENMTIMPGVTLSVYRREFDGGFTELATNLDSENYTTIVDPHPSLDYARYRIVATSKTTGAVSFYDMPGYRIGGIAAVIQWDEAWSSFDTTEEADLAQPAWTGSLLKLPYNIDVSDNNQPDVSLVEFIGRSHPVAYYGTHRGSSSTWKMDIEKKDKETLYALRRLANWMGNVYVREPSGSGYWANVNVSFSQNHLDTIIPVTLNISRVEGGV